MSEKARLLEELSGLNDADKARAMRLLRVARRVCQRDPEDDGEVGAMTPYEDACASGAHDALLKFFEAYDL